MTIVSYKNAGVDLDVYQQSMARLPRLMNRTHCPRTMKLDGGFAGLFQLDFSNPMFRRNYDEPVMIACTDGVGTKLKVAMMADRHETVGIDLVAMCVNDAICCGAEPLFFLDYIAMSHDDPARLEQVVEGISAGCLDSGCSLLGGETAIMPDLYAKGDYDLAGFCVGVAEKKQLITGKAIEQDDVLIGIASNGLHSNGYSLVRKIVFEVAELGINDHVEELSRSVADELLRPTKIYVNTVRRILNHYKVKNVAHGIAHITGGGLEENLERIIPAGLTCKIDYSAWQVPAVFSWLQKLGNVERDEMFRVFNMGIGLVLIVNEFYVNSIQKMIADSGHESWQIGRIVKSQ